MKNKVSLLLAIIVLSIIFSLSIQAQTYVSGGIYSNTIWTTANNPYIVVDTVVVFPGVTLTIQPGVIIKFADQIRLEIRQATIIAEGTSTDSITFTSNSTSPIPGKWDCIYLNGTPSDTIRFSYCKFFYATKGITSATNLATNWVKINFCRFSNNQTGIIAGTGNTYLIENSVINFNQTGITYNNAGYCPGLYINNCIIESNITAGISLHAGKNSVENCNIRYNGIGLYDYGVIGRKYTYNVIENNNIGIKAGEYMNVDDNISCNSICANTLYNIYYTDNTGGSINISNNYWCTTDSTTIATSIYDGYDNINLGLVTFIPLDNLQCHPATGIPINELPNFTFNIFPNPASTNLTITLPTNISNIEVKIFNMLGDIEYTSTATKQYTNIDISILTTGLHIIQMETGDNICRQKFVKQ